MGKVERLLLGLLILFSTGWHLAFIGTTELDLFPDEAQYWDWSRRPDWGYYSKPPLVAWTILASRALVGEETPFAVRLPAPLLAAAATLLVFALARLASGSDRAALLAAVAFRLAPLFVSEAVVLSTDSLLLVFWTMLAVFLYRATILGEGRAWLGAGLAMGLGTLSKYSMLVGLVWVAGVSRREHRSWIGAAAAIWLLAFIPPLVWNAQNGWASFRHVAGGAGKPGHIGAFPGATALEFVASQLGVMTPVLFGAIVWALWRCWRNRDEVDRFLLWGSLPMAAMYLGASFLGRAEANWAAPVYVAGLAALARHGGAQLWKWALVVALPFTAIAYDFDLLHAAGLPIKPKQNPTMRMRGWKELGQAVAAEAAKWPKGREPFLLAESYQVAAELAFYVPGQPRVYVADLGRRRNQYDYWKPGLDAQVGRDALYVTEGDWASPHHLLRRAFERFERAETFVHQHRGKPARWFSLYRLYGFKGEGERLYEWY